MRFRVRSASALSAPPPAGALELKVGSFRTVPTYWPAKFPTDVST